MLKQYLKRLGKLESFEIRNSSIVLCLISPGLYLYSVLIFEFNVNAVELPYMRELFSTVFLAVGLLPRFKRKWIYKYYGLFVFTLLFTFQFYLTYTVALNNFSIDYLLGSYIVMFGGILMLTNRTLVIIFSAIQLLHMTYRVVYSEVDILTEGAILISIATIFIYSFIIINGIMRYRKGLEAVNRSLEKNIEQRTRDLETRARELELRNKDLEEFAYVVSHDLKRHLRNIHTLAEWVTLPDIDEEEVSKEEMAHNLKTLKEQVDIMDLLINGILNYSLQANKEHAVKLLNVTEELMDLVEKWGSDVVIIKFLNKFPEIYYNQAQFTQIFQNLIDNAIKHNDKAVAKVAIDYYKEGEEHVFVVSDNGPGIEEKYHDKIFQLFQKLELDVSSESIGIGLALVKKIVERHGGRIWVSSDLERGTKFYFTILQK